MRLSRDFYTISFLAMFEIVAASLSQFKPIVLNLVGIIIYDSSDIHSYMK